VDRRRFLLTSLAGALAAPRAAGAQQSGRVARIGYLMRVPEILIPPFPKILAGLKGL
jgi:hypothetical protein